MNLDKAICIRCINKNHQCSDWNNIDDLRWNNGFVICPYYYKYKINKTYTDVIPDKCKYHLEHIVSNNEIR